MKQQKSVKPNGYVAVNHDLGVFLDPEKYAPILKITDEAAVVLRLSLLVENFLEVFIKNIREKGTEKYVKCERYFIQKVEISVALGLPVIIADAIVKINAIRNKFAHKMDYVMSSEDYSEVENVVNNIGIDVINQEGKFNFESIEGMFKNGVDSLFFIKSIPFSTSEKHVRLQRLTGSVFILANKCAFFTLNELQRKGKLNLS